VHNSDSQGCGTDPFSQTTSFLCASAHSAVKGTSCTMANAADVAAVTASQASLVSETSLDGENVMKYQRHHLTDSTATQSGTGRVRPLVSAVCGKNGVQEWCARSAMQECHAARSSLPPPSP